MWRTVKLGDVCLVRRGTTITKRQTDEGNIPVIGGGTKPTYYHNEANRAANCITISGSGASAGFVNKWVQEIFASDCSTVEPKDENQLYQFVYYYLLSQQQYIYDNFRSGAAQPHVYAKDIATLPFPIIPLAEQQRIVAKLDAVFAEIEREARYTELRIDEISTLQSLANDSLVKHYLRSFPSKPLGTLGDLKNGLNYSKSEKGYAVKILGVGDFQNNFHVESSFLAQIELSSVVPEDYLIKDDDILFVRSNGNRELIGRSVLVRNIQEPTTFSGFTIRFRLDDIKISPEYICHILKSAIVRNKLVDGGGGSSISNLNQKMLAEIVIPLAGKLEQQDFLEKMNSYITLFEKSLASSMKKIELLKALKSAILAQELQLSEAA